MRVELLNEHQLEFLSLKGGCTGSSESTLVKMPHCWKSHVVAHMSLFLSVVIEKLERMISTRPNIKHLEHKKMNQQEQNRRLRPDSSLSHRGLQYILLAYILLVLNRDTRTQTNALTTVSPVRARSK